MKSTMKSYRMREDTLKELEELKNYYEMTETDIIRWAITSMHYNLTKGKLKGEG